VTSIAMSKFVSLCRVHKRDCEPKDMQYFGFPCPFADNSAHKYAIEFEMPFLVNWGEGMEIEMTAFKSGRWLWYRDILLGWWRFCLDRVWNTWRFDGQRLLI